MTLAEHLDELRKRIMWAILAAAAFVGVCAYFDKELLAIAMAPAHAVLQELPRKGAIIATQVGEQFFTGIKVAIVAGVLLGSPVILWILWGFVARGLHPHEKRWVNVFAPISYLLFVAGCLFFYFGIQPFTLRFLLGYLKEDVQLPGGEAIPVDTMLSLRETLSFFLSMTLVTGLIFEMPLVMLFLQAVRICTWRTYVRHARHFVMGLTVFSAFITPTGDFFTLLVFMAPVLVLFGGGILACRIMAPKDLEV